MLFGISVLPDVNALVMYSTLDLMYELYCEFIALIKATTRDVIRAMLFRVIPAVL